MLRHRSSSSNECDNDQYSQGARQRIELTFAAHHSGRSSHHQTQAPSRARVRLNNFPATTHVHFLNQRLVRTPNAFSCRSCCFGSGFFLFVLNTVDFVKAVVRVVALITVSSATADFEFHQLRAAKQRSTEKGKNKKKSEKDV